LIDDEGAQVIGKTGFSRAKLHAVTFVVVTL
jgi:hypothetical protein